MDMLILYYFCQRAECNTLCYFHDKTLIALATEKPTSTKSMAAITGIGDTKIIRYGDAFLEVIETFER